MKINEVSKRLSLPISTLHYYERTGLITPDRSENNYRYYKEEDINNLVLISIMKKFDFSIQEIKEVMNRYTEMNPSEVVTNEAKDFFEEKIEQLKKSIDLHNKVIKIIENLPILDENKLNWDMKKNKTMDLALDLYQKFF